MRRRLQLRLLRSIASRASVACVSAARGLRDRHHLVPRFPVAARWCSLTSASACSLRRSPTAARCCIYAFTGAHRCDADRAVGRARRAGAAQHRRVPHPLHQPSVPAHVPAHAAVDVADREGRARSRHGVVGRRAVHRRSGLGKAAVGDAAAADRRRAGVHRRPVRRAVPHDRRLGHHAPPRRSAAAPVGLHQEQGLLRDDHPEEVRRPGILRVRALVRAGEALEPLRRRRIDRRGAELARPRRAAASLRHRRAARLTTCRASRAAKKSRASRSPGRAPAPMRRRFPTPASCAKACTKAARSSACG